LTQSRTADGRVFGSMISATGCRRLRHSGCRRDGRSLRPPFAFCRSSFSSLSKHAERTKRLEYGQRQIGFTRSRPVRPPTATDRPTSHRRQRRQRAASCLRWRRHGSVNKRRRVVVKSRKLPTRAVLFHGERKHAFAQKVKRCRSRDAVLARAIKQTARWSADKHMAFSRRYYMALIINTTCARHLPKFERVALAWLRLRRAQPQTVAASNRIKLQ
jgi:hypothetical protein